MATKAKKDGVYARCIKRFLDILLSLVFLALFWWVYAIIAILVRIKLGAPVVFKQPRPGKDEEIFNLYKFRSMTDERNEHGELLPDKDRLTPFGKKLRSTSLDELPEILNILKGDMSFVGPRPLLVEYLPRYSEEQRHRHDVRPGLTGFAQVHGRNALSWEDRFKKDVFYVDRISFLMDIRIFLKTIFVVMARKDITSASSVTMESFRGIEGGDDESVAGRIVIVGANGYGKAAADIAKKAGYKVILFADDDAEKGFCEYQVVCPSSKIEDFADGNTDFFLAVESNEARREIAQGHDLNWVTLVHPDACVEPGVSIGLGTLIMAGANIDAHVSIGDFCIVGECSTIGHDGVLENYVHVSPNAALGGTVRVGESVRVGIGATISDNTNICSDCVIKAGAIVVKDITASSTYVGMPAKTHRGGALTFKCSSAASELRSAA